MNVIVRAQPSAEKLNEATAIAAEERARRKAAVDYARGSVRLEGHILSPFAEETYRRFIDGNLTRAELRSAMLDHYKP